MSGSSCRRLVSFSILDLSSNLVPSDEASVEHAVKVSEHVDLILLDSGNTKSTIKALGGTGRTHDWNLSARVVESVDCPVFLAGGNNPSKRCEA